MGSYACSASFSFSGIDYSASYIALFVKLWRLMRIRFVDPTKQEYKFVATAPKTRGPGECEMEDMHKSIRLNNIKTHSASNDAKHRLTIHVIILRAEFFFFLLERRRDVSEIVRVYGSK